MKKKGTRKTESLCPHCFKKIDAEYIEKADNIYLKKECPDHGVTETLVWEGVNKWEDWIQPLVDYEQKNVFKEVEKGCPYDCGICSDHKQDICCVLLEVTKQCNLNCPICFASANEFKKEDANLETIARWYDRLIDAGGPFNIQLSGGEPTMRDDLDDIIKLGKEKGFNFFQLNTNGIRIAEDINYLKSLVEAGLDAVFLQFDGFKKETYISLRGVDILELKKQAIENCKKLGIGVMLVPTLRRGLNDDEIGDIIEFALKNMPYVRGVHFQPMSFFGRFDKSPSNKDRLTIPRLIENIEMQTNKKMTEDSFKPGNSGHYLCTFNANFIVKDDGSLKPIVKEPCSCSGAKVKNIVANKWKLPSKDALEEMRNLDISKLDSLERFIVEKEVKTLSISCMAFQDIWNLDLERLKRCYVNELSEDKDIIPFCIYNITNIKGESLYRK